MAHYDTFFIWVLAADNRRWFRVVFTLLARAVFDSAINPRHRCGSDAIPKI
jgi:hypothetical protein